MAYKIENIDGVVIFTIERLEKRNAINFEVIDGFNEVVAYVKEQPEVRF